MGEVIAENTEQRYLETDQEYNKRVLDTARIITAITGLATGQEAEDINTAVDTATNAVINNYLAHNVRLNLEKANKDCANGVEVACNAADFLKTLNKDSYLTELDRKILEDYDKYNNNEFLLAYNLCSIANICSKIYELHTVQRNKWNLEAYNQFKKNPQNWILMSDSENSFHNPTLNIKYVDKSGQMEVIINRRTGNLVSAGNYKGTYNYSSPNNSINHFVYDILPWLKFGNNGSK